MYYKGGWINVKIHKIIRLIESKIIFSTLLVIFDGIIHTFTQLMYLYSDRMYFPSIHNL